MKFSWVAHLVVGSVLVACAGGDLPAFDRELANEVAAAYGGGAATAAGSVSPSAGGSRSAGGSATSAGGAVVDSSQPLPGPGGAAGASSSMQGPAGAGGSRAEGGVAPPGPPAQISACDGFALSQAEVDCIEDWIGSLE